MQACLLTKPAINGTIAYEPLEGETVPPYLPAFKLLAIALFLAAVFGAGYGLRDLQADKADAQQLSGMLADQLNSINKQLELQAAGQKKLNESLARVPGKETIREIVKDNPSGCVLPGPVADGLRRQVDQANAAIDSAR